MSFDDKIKQVEKPEKLLKIFQKLLDKQEQLDERFELLEEQLEDVNRNTRAVLEMYDALEEQEDKIGDRLDRLGQIIIEDFGAKEEGSETTNYGPFKVKTTGRKYRNVDKEKYEDIKDDLPEEARAVFKKKYKVSKTRLEDLEKVDPGTHKQVMRAIKISKGSTGLKVEREDD